MCIAQGHKAAVPPVRLGPVDSRYRVPTSSGNHGKPGKSLKKVPCMEKSWNLKKPEYSWNNHGILRNNLMKPQVDRKLAVRHIKIVCLTASFLAMAGFKV